MVHNNGKDVSLFPIITKANELLLRGHQNDRFYAAILVKPDSIKEHGFEKNKGRLEEFVNSVGARIEYNPEHSTTTYILAWGDSLLNLASKDYVDIINIKHPRDFR